MNQFIKEFLNLHIGQDDNAKILESVKSNISFRGANLWILACAILVASVGLNVNSTAVIIGAMLISPLMGPILGSGFALGIYDFQLLKRSMRNLLVATFTSLLVSAVYFYLSPFKQAQSELLSRTSPSIYDVLIAFFGGLVGVIAVTRVEKGNPIPGVAIATALMPPLCTAGYGLATGNLTYFLGAMFLYTINCVFICMSTFAIVKYLNFPAKSQVNKEQQDKVRWGIITITFLVMIPSIWLAWRLYQEQKFIENANEFIQTEFKHETIIFKKLDYKSNPHKIDLACFGHAFKAEELEALNKKLPDYHLMNTEVHIRNDNNLENLKSDILNEVTVTENIANEKDMLIKSYQEQLDSYENLLSPQIYSEARAIVPALNHLSLGKHHTFMTNDTAQSRIVALISAQDLISPEEQTRLKEWLKLRLGDTSIVMTTY